MTKKIVKKGSKVTKTVKKVTKKATQKKVAPKKMPVKKTVKNPVSKTTKKVVKVVKKVTPKKVEDHTILEDTMQVIQKLGKDVKTMAKAKDFLKDEIVKLDKRISVKEKVNVADKFVTKVRDEIIQDFEPIFKKVNPNNIKKQIKDEIIKTIELETSKIKSELSSKTTKTNRELTQKLSSLESQIMDAISNSNQIKKQFSKLKTSELNNIKEELANSIKTSIINLNKKFVKSLSDNGLEIEELKKSLNSQKSQLTKFKTEIKKEIVEENADLSEVLINIKKLEKEYKSISNLLKKSEKELRKDLDSQYKNLKKSVLDLEEKITVLSSQSSNDEDLAIRIESLNKELGKHEKELLQLAKYIDDESQVEIKEVKNLSSKISSLENSNKATSKELSLIKLELDNLIDRVSVLKGIDSERNDEDLAIRIQVIDKELKKFKASIKKDLKVDANDLSALNSKIQKLENEHKSINSLVQKFEDKLYEKTQKESIEVEKRVKELLKKTGDKLKEVQSEKTDSQKFFVDELKLIKTEIDTFEDKIKVIEAQNKDAISKDLASKVNELKATIQDIEKKTTKSFEVIEKEKEAQKDFLVKEYNKVAKDLELIESKYEQIAKAELNTLKVELEAEIKKDFDELRKSITQFDGSREDEVKQVINQLEKSNEIFLKDIQSKYSEINKLVEKKISGANKSLIKEKSDLENKVTKFKLELSKLAEKHFAKVDKKLSKLEKDSKDFTRSKQEIVKNLNDKIKSEVKVFDEKLGEATVKVNSLIEKLEEEKRAEAMYLKDRANEVIDKFEKLALENEAHLVAVEKRVIDGVHNELKVFDGKLDEATVKVNSLVSDLEEEKKNEAMYLKDKTNELIDKFNKLALENEAKLAVINTKASQQIEEKLSKVHDSVSEKLAKDIVNNNEFLNKLKLENKEDKRALTEDIETKFVNAKLQFEESFKEHVLTFDKALEAKEKEFTNKIKDVYNEKEALIIEMGSFKDEVGVLTKDYVTKLDEELQKLRTAEANFSAEKDSFFTHIDNLVQAKKLELQDYGQNIESQIYELIKNQKETFNKNENSFREVFNEKIANLRDYQVRKLDSIEKKFVDKNLKYVKDKIDSQLEFLNLFEQKLESKEEEISKHLEILDDSKNMLHQEFTGEFENLRGKVEERLTKAEQQFNRRFIDYDSTISQFKAVVIDEVEGLMREVNQTINPKIEQLDLAFEKVENLGQGVAKNLEEIKRAKLIMDKEFRNIRGELSDLRVGFESATHLKLGGMNNLVQNMSEYENQLIDLVTSLKQKGVSDANILNALITKGHPRMYATMIINNLDQILLK